MKPDQALPISQTLKAIGRPVAYYPSMAHALGNVKAALLACQFLYWEGKQEDPDGWIYKTQADIQRETGLTRTEQENARRTLRKAGILEEKRKGTPARLFFRFDWDAFDQVLTQHFNNKDQPKKPKKPRKEEPTERQPTLLQQMREEFDRVHLDVFGFDYNWSKSKQDRGKDWGNLKRMAEFFQESYTGTNQDGATDEDILHAWKVYLEKLPTYHKTRNLTPAKLYSNRNEIIQEIKTTHNGSTTDSAGSKSNGKQSVASSANTFV